MISGLYAVTPEMADTAMLLARVEAALIGGARAVQFRAKRAGAESRLETARALAAACRRHGALFIVNDDPVLARAVDADGVHIGREDRPLAEVRSALGPGAVVGVSCYDDLQRARMAAAGGASYVAFGSFFPSPTKPAARRATVELLQRAAREIRLPLVAIGGITVDNALELVEAGADALAVVSGLFDAPDVTVRAREFSSIFIEETED